MFSPLLLIIAAQAAQADQATPSATQMKSVVQDCSAHKFETVVTALVDGVAKSSKLKLCGTSGQTDSQWLETLRDSVSKLSLNYKLQPAMREAMVAALNGEIARLHGGPSSQTASSGPITIKPRTQPTKGELAGYASLPPLSVPSPLANVSLSQAPKLLPPVSRPPIRLECFVPGAAGEGPCTEFDRSTLLIIAARGTVPAGVSLRFLRDGEQRAEVTLGPMGKGQSRRIALPAPVCHGVTSAELKVETMVTPPVKGAAPQRTATEGPFNLRCY